MIFIHDSRDKEGKHDNLESWMQANGHELIRQKMDVGDVMLLGDGSICIDLKSLGLAEVYSNLVHDHRRFRDECIRARDSGVKLIVLVEESGIHSLEDVKSWVNPQVKRRQRQDNYTMFLIANGKLPPSKMPKKPPVDSSRLAGMMDAMHMNYGVEWMFCDPSDVGKTVVEILAGSYNIVEPR